MSTKLYFKSLLGALLLSTIYAVFNTLLGFGFTIAYLFGYYKVLPTDV
jgi:hypothetical protein